MGKRRPVVIREADGRRVPVIRYDGVEGSMSDTKKPEDEQGKPVAAEGASEQDQREPQALRGTVIEESSRTPVGNGAPPQREGNSRQWREQVRFWLPIFISVVTLAVSFGSLDVARKSSGAAKRSAEVAAASVRAWVVPIQWQNIQVKSAPVSFPLVIKNAGKTPAEEVEWWWEISVQRTPPPFNKCPTEHHGRYGVLPFDQTWLIEMKESLSPDDLQVVVDVTGDRRLYLHTCINYRDVLAHRERLTELCAVYDPAQNYPNGKDMPNCNRVQ